MSECPWWAEEIGRRSQVWGEAFEEVVRKAVELPEDAWRLPDGSTA